jgi:hypothetical protein
MARRRGRPNKGADLVTDVEGSEQARQRLKIILQTLAGAMTIEQGCDALGVRRSGFHKLRRQFLARATDLLEPRPRGRQRRQASEVDRQIAQLKHQIVQLKLDLKAQQIREEIALVMPHLLKNKRAATRKKTSWSNTRGGSIRSVR